MGRSIEIAYGGKLARHEAAIWRTGLARCIGPAVDRIDLSELLPGHIEAGLPVADIDEFEKFARSGGNLCLGVRRCFDTRAFIYGVDLGGERKDCENG